MKTSVLFKNLQALEDASFPKACQKCGDRFENEIDYFQNTTPYKKGSGLTEAKNEQGDSYVKLVRVCHCGQPILDHFGDRRDTSKKGEIRRQAFNKVIRNLTEAGLDKNLARTELLNYMNNKKSDILEKMGIFNR